MYDAGHIGQRTDNTPKSQRTTNYAQQGDAHSLTGAGPSVLSVGVQETAAKTNEHERTAVKHNTKARVREPTARDEFDGVTERTRAAADRGQRRRSGVTWFFLWVARRVVCGEVRVYV